MDVLFPPLLTRCTAKKAAVQSYQHYDFDFSIITIDFHIIIINFFAEIINGITHRYRHI